MANKLPRIEIRTRLHDSIDKNYGGGEWRVVETFTVGPRNIIKAADSVYILHAYNVRCYGNVGCGRTVAYLVDKDGEVDITAVLNDERWDGKKTSKLDAKALRKEADLARRRFYRALAKAFVKAETTDDKIYAWAEFEHEVENYYGGAEAIAEIAIELRNELRTDARWEAATEPAADDTPSVGMRR